ncbi:hypothetical protein GOBAR_AA09139 [Gossypium barbadense]|uniref:Uncharacterized protein n=1 Tax=Gossypium barbadense TaxID=3634 RepID=A0A2P5Y7D3_GOSBA|nr:hypothetical protein GOBAR_AA09139 [Gossypium barbadense]
MPNPVKFLNELLTTKRKLDEASHVELNAEISSKNLHEPCSSNNKGPLYEERRLQIEELDEWRAHKSRTHDKPKPRHDDLNVAPNQLKVGDKVLLDAANHRIVTSKPNGAIPLMVLSIFPYGTVEVIHPKFGTFKFSNPHGRAHWRALGRAHTTRRDTVVCYGQVKTGQNFSLAWDAISGHGRATWPWASLSNQHGRATSLCLGTMVETEKLARSCNTPVPTIHAQD